MVDSIKPSSAPVVSQSSPVEAPKPPPPPPPPPALQVGQAGFDDPKAKPVSVSGRYTPVAFPQPARAELVDDVSAQRSVSGVNGTSKTEATWGPNIEQVRAGTSVLKAGQKGSGVESLQKSLAEAGYPVKASGVYDDETLNAVRTFQKDNGLKGNGGLVDKDALSSLDGAGRRDERMKAIVKDKKIDATEARQAVRAAMGDSCLREQDRSEKNVVPALVNMYSRAGLSLDEARVAAGKTWALSERGGEAVTLTGARQAPWDRTKTESLRASAEGDAAMNADRQKLWTTKDLKKDPAGFVRNMPQYDGDPKTKPDQSSCHTMSMLAGSILKRPESAQELGDKLLSPAGQKEFPEMQKEPLRSSAQRMKDGKFSPADVTAIGASITKSMTYVDPTRPSDKEPSVGMGPARELALQGKLQNIGWQPAEARVDSYGTTRKAGNHATAYANGMGYDPFNYQGSNGQATVTRGEASARAHALNMSPRFGNEQQAPRVLLSRTEYDGKGGMRLERGWIDEKEMKPPLSAKYSWEPATKEWVRDPAAKIPAEYEKNFPARVSSDLEALKQRTDVEH